MTSLRKSSQSSGPCSELDEEYASFRASVPLKKVTCVEENGRSREWLYFESGPKSIKRALLFLPPLTGGADVYFKQIVSLSALGFRVISIELPVFWSINNFCRGFQCFLDALNLDKVHIFGASLGGYLAQMYAESSPLSKVASLILCNSFTDTSIFNRQDSVLVYWALPAMVLKRILLGGFPHGTMSMPIAESIDFMVEKIDRMNQEQLASRMTLNCSSSSCDTSKIAHFPITIINVLDSCALSEKARSDIMARYPKARRAELKSGGNFPFLSQSAEVDLHIKIHLARFDGTSLSARSNQESVTP